MNNSGCDSYPIELAAQVAINTVTQSVATPPSIQQVVFCCFSAVDLAVYEHLLSTPTASSWLEPDGLDSFGLERFVQAQQDTYADAWAELQAGRKETHWSWYIFPQLKGLGSSPLSMRYAISGLPEARAYLVHPTLSARLVACITALNQHTGLTIETMLGPVDVRKFQTAAPSSTTHWSRTSRAKTIRPPSHCLQR